MTRKVISMLMFLLVLGMSACFAEWRTMTVTAYCDQGYTASGEYVSEGMVASDDLPIGTTVVINGESYIVADRFGGGYSDRLDIYMPSYDDCVEFGVQTLDVYVDR